ncbi:MAG TPA: hypothetical protein VIL34_00795 [Actinopolymorphaceae bacterium]
MRSIIHQRGIPAGNLEQEQRQPGRRGQWPGAQRQLIHLRQIIEQEPEPRHEFSCRRNRFTVKVDQVPHIHRTSPWACEDGRGKPLVDSNALHHQRNHRGEPGGFGMLGNVAVPDAYHIAQHPKRHQPVHPL